MDSNVFHKLTKKLHTQVDEHMLEVEVREDEEQHKKLQEIIDLLVAAGYFRARIKGLLPFDKVVGGMTWCIESCNVDVDVDLLFQENSTIGQKIALTEIIVMVLPKMKCPHNIEPHQIQGLDFIHIFPVIQWLVKRSMEYRQEMSEFVRCYAVNQFNKCYGINTILSNSEPNMVKSIATVSEIYDPRRYYKRKNAPPPDIHAQVQVTLMEYGSVPHTIETVTNEAMDHENLNREDLQNLTEHYVSLQLEFKIGSVKILEDKQILALLKQMDYLDELCSKLNSKKCLLEESLKNSCVQFQEIKEKQHENQIKLNEFKSRKADKIEETKHKKPVIKSNKEVSKLSKELSADVKLLRLQVAKRNRTVAAVHRQIDDVPNRPELAQYQRRFLELYSQVSAKHRETKQYYTLYNTMEDTKVYMKKELSLLNSISDSYPEAIISSYGKEEFLKQFQNIIEGVTQSKEKVQKQLLDEKRKRDQLSSSLQILIEQQRKYVTAVRQLSIECKKHEILLNRHTV
ncbi:coiled-coil domain-containing protein 93 isoform X4 [Tenebrio molitor]|uniref:coiled-coil domain-containing protein 93 isoform X4 n=1 Tax=Tenebrio molitor TaxID=7067 RepID=UPI00362476E1